MNCEVIQDLLPLYVDECCSEESKKLVKAHLDSCPGCRDVVGVLERSRTMQPMERKEVPLHRISNWKASVLQSAMLFVSFVILAFGVIMEGGTPTGETNGLWAVALIVPATGYLLSQANLFFVRVYKSRKAFSNGSGLVTLAITVLGYVWAAVHYMDGIVLASPLVWGGVALSVVLCALSKFLSDRYALLLGKE